MSVPIRAVGQRYRGVGASTASSRLVLVEDAGTGQVLGPLQHRVRYSPTGFNWGYDGAGPRDLARSLLSAVLGDEARCRRCLPATASAGCSECVDGLRPDLPETEFVREIVARLPPSWTLHEAEIRMWCNNQAWPGGHL